MAGCEVTPLRQPSPSHHSSPPISPTHPSSTRGDVLLHSQDVDLLSQPEMVSSTAQLMDVDTQHTPGQPSTGDVEHVHASAATDGTARVSHPLQVPPLWYIPLNGGNRTEAFNPTLARVTMHQPHMGHTHVRSALNL